MKDYLRYVPGFRSGKRNNKILASIYYVLSLFQGSFWMFLAAISLPFLVFGLVDLIKNRKNVRSNPKLILTFLIPLIIFSVSSNLVPDEDNDDLVDVNTLASMEEIEEEEEIVEEDEVELEVEEEEEDTVSLSELEKATVVKHVDGDTVYVTLEDGKEYKVRFIGVDTPETVHPYRSVGFYGEQASKFTEERLLGKTVYLEKDITNTDKYDRLLRYIWLEEPTEVNQEEIKTKMFNAILVAEGYAQVSTYQPDVKYQEHFVDFARDARENELGLWDKKAELAYKDKEAQEKAEKEKAEKEKAQANAAAKSNSNPTVSAPDPAPAPPPAPVVKETAPPATDNVAEVYITNTGTKYHRGNCRYLKDSSIPISLSKAQSGGYEACKVCKP